MNKSRTGNLWQCLLFCAIGYTFQLDDFSKFNDAATCKNIWDSQYNSFHSILFPLLLSYIFSSLFSKKIPFSRIPHVYSNTLLLQQAFFSMKCCMDIHHLGERQGKRHLPTFSIRILNSQALYRWDSCIFIRVLSIEMASTFLERTVKDWGRDAK